MYEDDPNVKQANGMTGRLAITDQRAVDEYGVMIITSTNVRGSRLLKLFPPCL